MDGNDGPRKDTEDTTRFTQIEEVKFAIWALPFVSKLSTVGGRNSHGDDVSSRKRISTSGLRDLSSMRSVSRWYGSNLVALVMGKVRGMASDPW
jgi:hypothetical protein